MIGTVSQETHKQIVDYYQQRCEAMQRRIDELEAHYEIQRQNEILTL